MRYNVAPIYDATHYNVSEFDLVKSTDITYTRDMQNLIDVDRLRETSLINHIKEMTLNNLLRLDREYTTIKNCLRDTVSSVHNTRAKLVHLDQSLFQIKLLMQI